MEGSESNLITYCSRRKSAFRCIQKIINSYRNFENDKVMNKVIKDTEKEVYTLYDEAKRRETLGDLFV